jgi:hypothetical protein
MVIGKEKKCNDGYGLFRGQCRLQVELKTKKRLGYMFFHRLVTGADIIIVYIQHNNNISRSFHWLFYYIR